jgi:hypothetical protein
MEQFKTKQVILDDIIKVVCFSPFVFWISLHRSDLFDPHIPMFRQKFTGKIPLSLFQSSPNTPDFYILELSYYMATTDLSEINENKSIMGVLKTDVDFFLKSDRKAPIRLYLKHHQGHMVTESEEELYAPINTSDAKWLSLKKKQILFLFGREHIFSLAVANPFTDRNITLMVPSVKKPKLGKKGNFDSTYLLGTTAIPFYDSEEIGYIDFPCVCLMEFEKEESKEIQNKQIIETQKKEVYAFIRFEKLKLVRQFQNKTSFIRATIVLE